MVHHLWFGKPDRKKVVHLCSCVHGITLPGIDVGGYIILPTPAAQDLGVLVDSHLTLSKLNSESKSAFFSISNMGRIRKYFDSDSCEILVHTFISSELDSYNRLPTGLPDKKFSSLHCVQNAAVRLIVDAAKNKHVTHVTATTLVACKVQN